MEKYSSVSFEGKGCLEAIMQQASIGILIVDGSGLIEHANLFAENMFGYNTGELSGIPFEALVPGMQQRFETKRKHACLIKQADDQLPLEYKLSGYHKNGYAFPVELSLACFAEGGEPKTITFISDISELKEKAEQLEANEQNIRSLIEHTPAAVAMFDRDMRYIAVSRRWLQDYQLNDHAIIGKSHYEIFPEIPERWKEIYARGLSGEELRCMEDPFPRIDGRIDWVQWELCPWYTTKSEIGGIILFTEVITQQKLAREQLERHASELEAMVEEKTRSLQKMVTDLEKTKRDLGQSLEKEKELGLLKSNFVSIASHEFRTPLSAIQLSATLIDKYTLTHSDELITKHVRKIKNATANLTNILNDFLSLEKLETGKVNVNLAEFDLVALAEEITREMQFIAKQNQHIIYQHTGAERMVYLDQSLLRTIIVNLISNAIKYSGEDTFIEIGTRLVDEELVLMVNDNGIGIPETDQKHLFEAFFRANNTGTIPGTGLGLNIVERYTRKMNGKIKFKSSAEKGTSFTIIFPLNNNSC